MNKEDYVSIEVAKLLKEKGYNYSSEWYVEGYCTNNETLYPKPTLYESAKFLREKHNIHITIGNSASGYWFELSKANNGTTIYYSNYSGSNEGGRWDSYEEALNAGVLSGLKYI